MAAPITAVESKDHGNLNHIYLLAGYVSALVLVIALTYFSRYSLVQERFVLTMGFLGLAIAYWINCFVTNNNNLLSLNLRRPTLDAATPIVIALMIAAGLIEPLQQPVVLVQTIGYDSIIKALFMISVSAVLPGLLLFSLINSTVRPLLRFVISVHLSLGIIALMTYALYYTHGGIELMFPSIVITIASLWSLRLFVKYRQGDIHLQRSRILESFPVTTPLQLTIDKWSICLALLIVAIIAIGFTFHDSQRYMIPGDAWRVLQPGVDLIAGRNISETALVDLEYPIAYGFLMAGLSGIAGIPIVNVNMFLFPFIALNLLSFYTLVRYVFRIGRSVATTASFIYVFTGGLGWLMAQILQMKADFWTLSYKTQDMLFSYYFLDNIQFWHRTLAVTFGFAAITTFFLAVNTGGRRKWAFLGFASLFMLMSFFIHMLPLVFVFPAIAYLWWTRGRHSWRILSIFALCTIAIAGISDALLSGYYSSLTLTKVGDEFFPSLQVSSGSMSNLNTRISGVADMLINGYYDVGAKVRNEILPSFSLLFDSVYNPDTVISSVADTFISGYNGIVAKIRDEFLPFLKESVAALYNLDIGIAVSIGLGPMLFTVISHNKKGMKRLENFAKSLSETVPGISFMISSFEKILDNRILPLSSPALFGAILVGIYIYGIAVWATFPPTGGLLYEINRLPWYFLPIRFGFIGLLAIAALFFIKQRDRWMGVFVAWFLAVFILGNIWWGPKILSYLFPLVAFLAALSLFSMRRNVGRLAIPLKLEGRSKSLARLVGVTGLSAMVILSTSSYIYGFSQYVGSSSKDDKVFGVISWIYTNVPENEKIALYTDEYSLEVGASSLSAHEVIVAKDLRNLLADHDAREMGDLGFKYFVGKDNEVPRAIQHDSFVLHKSEDIVVLFVEPSYVISRGDIFSKGSGTTEIVVGEYSSFNKNWQITWLERMGIEIELEQTIPRGSNLNFVLMLDQSEWGTASAVQELQVRLISGEGSIQTVDLLADLGKGVSKQFLINADNDVNKIEFLAVNGGTNNASMSISDIKYLTPDGTAVRIS